EPPAAGSPFAVRGQVKRPLLTELQEGHPLLRWITLTDVNIAESEVFGLERGDFALASSVHQPLIVAGARGGQKMMAIGFDLRRSDLPMRVAFPVLLHDALDWFAGDDAAQLVGTYQTGRAWRLAPPAAGASEVVLEAPDGTRATAPVGDDGFATFFGRRVGFHKVRAGGAEAELAANLADPAESDLTPRPLGQAGPPALGG